ncbi:MAG: ABC-type dipeptide/oligopeptide/nickel transport system permease component [Bacteroidia bacterium]|jgi:ABC-type dipeptide/oligopeptide/nickel transport system permease component
MIRYVVKKLGYALLILFSVASVVFWMFSYSFPNPEDILVTDRTDQSTLDAIKKELKLDQPKEKQYVAFLNDLSIISVYDKSYNVEVSHFKILSTKNKTVYGKTPYLRRSFQTGQPTKDILFDAFLGTLVLALAAMIFASFFGLIFGVLSSIKQGSWLDRSLLFVSTLGISVPSFFSAIVFSWLFGHVWHNWTGLNVVGSLYEIDPFSGKQLALKNLILPAFALGIRPLSIVTQLTRNAMLDALSKDYIRTAIAKGLSKRQVYFKHALKSALNPVITSVSGWFASLLAGAFFVEFIFSWKGLGSVTIHALETSDLPIIMGSIIFIAFIFVLINLLVDVLYTVLDPRIRLSA